MSEARIKQLEGDIRALQEKERKYRNLVRAVKKLYTAGYWTCDRIADEEAKQIFIELRDAANITPGLSPVPLVREGS